jgi:hypothetical protein
LSGKSPLGANKLFGQPGAGGYGWTGSGADVSTRHRIGFDRGAGLRSGAVVLQPLLKRVGDEWGTFRIIPVESGRGCPYGCEFCTVTAFFGDPCSPEAIANAVESVNHKPLGYRINILMSRLCFREIYFPQMGRFAWLKAIVENRRTIFKMYSRDWREGYTRWRCRLRSGR